MKKESAQSLLLVIFVITAFAATTVTLTVLSTRELEIREIEEATSKARYSSDAGYERALYYLKTITRKWPTYPYRRRITIRNQNDRILSNYPVPIIINTYELINGSPQKMENDCSDIRFTDSNGITLLNYFFEGPCNDINQPTRIWVEIPETPSYNTEKRIYVYYGAGAGVGSAHQESVCPGGIHQDPDDNQAYCFENFDNFEGTELNSDIWLSGNIGNTSVYVSGGICTLDFISGIKYADQAYLNSLYAFPRPLLAKFRIRTTRDDSMYRYMPSGGLTGLGQARLVYQRFLCRYNDLKEGRCDFIDHNGIVSTWKTDTIIWEENQVRFLVDGNLVHTETTYIPERPLRYRFYISCDQAIGCGGYDLFIDWTLARKYAPNPIDDNPDEEITISTIEESVPIGLLPQQVVIDTDDCPDSFVCPDCSCDRTELLQSQYEYDVKITPYGQNRDDGAPCSCDPMEKGCCCEPQEGNYCIDSTGRRY